MTGRPDDFTGAVNSLPSAANWIYDTGRAYPGGPDNGGTGEIQNYTTHPRNLALDGAGNLKITPQRDTRGLDFRPHRDAAHELHAADRRGLADRKRIQMPNATGASALGYWPAFWALGSAYRTDRWSWPNGEFDMMEYVNGGQLRVGCCVAAPTPAACATKPPAW